MRRTGIPELQSREWLQNRYIDQNETSREIATSLSCSRQTVLRTLANLGIPKRKATYRNGKGPDNKREHNPQWKGGRWIDALGYTRINVGPEYPGNHRGYVLEHRYFVEQFLGRYLSPQEHIHHINGVRDDNRIENLKLISRANHVVYDELCQSCPLRKEIRLLRWQVKELREQLQGKLI